MCAYCIEFVVYVGGFPLSRRKREFYGPGDELWRKFLTICRREESSGSEKLTEFIRRYVEVHAPGNPQTVMNSYAKNGSITQDNIEGRVRQLALEESRKGIPGEVGYGRVLEIVRGEGVQGKAAVAMADRTASWLYKTMKIKVWR
ncbi:MAG: hypothetical protein ACTSQ8_15125 [Candidatus Helarchaeota archaeon]